MKNKLKKIILSIALVFAVAIGSFVGLVSGVISLSYAEYKPTSVPSKPYDFSDNTGWSKNAISNNPLKEAFATSAVSQKLADLEEAYRPSTNYKGEELNENETSLVMIAKNAPVSVKMDKVENDEYVYEKDGEGNYVYVQEAGKDKVYSETERENDSEYKQDYVLIDNSNNQYHKRIRVQENKNTYFSYKTSASLSLSSNCYYVVTAYVWTKGAVATVTIGDRDNEISASATEVSAEGSWKEIWLFFETSASSSMSAYITLYYGSKDKIVKSSSAETEANGIVIFDHIDVQKISKTEYNKQTIAGEHKENVVFATGSARKDYTLDVSLVGDFENDPTIYGTKYGETGYDETLANTQYQYYVPKFADDKATDRLNDRQLASYQDAYSKLTAPSRVLEKDEFKTTDDKNNEITFDTFRENNHALKLENKSEKYDLGLLSPRFTIKQFAYYRLSVWTKSNDANAEAVVKLLSYIQTGNSNGANYTDGALQIASQTVTAFTKDNDITNNWTEVVFYIQGNPYRDTTLQIALLAGKESTVYFDEMRLEAITSATFSNASSSTKIDLGSSTITVENGITNGSFNDITVSDVERIEDVEKPYAPASWTKLDKNDSNVISGVISTTDSAFDSVKAKIGNVSTNPMTLTETIGSTPVYLPRTNILTIYSESKKTYGYKSSSFSLSSGSVYEITFYTFADKSNFEGTIYTNLLFSDENISEVKEEVVLGNGGQWTKHTVVVRTGASSRSLTLQIGVKDAKGTMYFRDFGYKKYEEKTVNDEKVSVDKQFVNKISTNGTLELQKTNNLTFIDFYGNSAVMHSSDKVADKDYFESLFYKKESIKENEKVQGELGVVETNSNVTLSTDPSLVLSSSFMKREGSVTDFALLLYNKEAGETKISPVSSSSLSSSSYYQITFYVKTANIEEAKGLTAKMSAISVEFTNINTGSLDNENNKYTKFTVLVKTGSSSISNFEIVFSLGTKGNEVSGVALVSDIDITKFANEDEYKKVLETVDKNDPNTIVKDFSSSNDKDDDADKSADSLTLATFFLVFSSILLVVAIVIALVAISIKKLPKSKTVVGTNNANVSKDKTTDTTSKDGFV